MKKKTDSTGESATKRTRSNVAVVVVVVIDSNSSSDGGGGCVAFVEEKTANVTQVSQRRMRPKSLG